jgi:hypothetical protein
METVEEDGIDIENASGAYRSIWLPELDRLGGSFVGLTAPHRLDVER